MGESLAHTLRNRQDQCVAWKLGYASESGALPPLSGMSGTLALVGAGTAGLVGIAG